MSNILSYDYYFPHYQVEEKTLSPDFGKNGKRIISYIDEDIITLAYESAKKCLANYAGIIDAVFFATTSPVFKNRYHASFLCDLLELPEEIFALDFTQTPRSGTDALLLANQLIDHGAYHNILVVAAEANFGAAGDELKNNHGHASCSLLLSKEKGIAEIRSSVSFSWAYAEDFVYKNNEIEYDPRYSREKGFKEHLETVLTAIGAYPNVYDAIILNSRFARMAGSLFTARGFKEAQFAKDKLTQLTGNTGCCHALLLAIDELDAGKENILLFDYFNGTNVIELGSTAQMVKSSDYGLYTKTVISNYQNYLAIKKVDDFNALGYESLEVFSSEMMQEREKDLLLYLHGLECEECGTVWLVKTAKCKKCNCDKFSNKKLSITGTVFSFTHEHYFPATFPPVTMVVVDLEGGARITVQLTDDRMNDTKDKVAIGAKIKLVLRKMQENGIKPFYGFKAKLI